MTTTAEQTARINEAALEALKVAVNQPNPEYLADSGSLAAFTRVVLDDESTLLDVEWAALGLISEWGPSEFYGKLNRFGEILWVVKDLPEVAHHVEAWDKRTDYLGGLDGWYETYTGQAAPSSSATVRFPRTKQGSGTSTLSSALKGLRKSSPRTSTTWFLELPADDHDEIRDMILDPAISQARIWDVLSSEELPEEVRFTWGASSFQRLAKQIIEGKL